MLKLLENFRAARRVSTPLIAIKTPDPQATIELIRNLYAQSENVPPMFRWDIAAGLTHLNAPGEEGVRLMSPMPKMLLNPHQALMEAAPKMPSKGMLFILNAHRYLDSANVVQAIWNLRDQYKNDKRTLILLCPEVKLPAELANDVFLLTESLPTEPELESIVCQTYKDAQLSAPDPDTLRAATDALAGLAAFPSEQATAMSLTQDGLDLEGLWERKRQMVEQTPGLSIWRGGETFADVEGYDNAKTFLTRVLQGKRPPRGVVFIDEIEKMFGGSGDTSGISQSLLGTLLSWMQDRGATGNIFIGAPGTGKSAIAKAVGGEGNIPTISFDVNSAKNSLVGESERNFRTALKVIDAVTQGHALFIATCNKIAVLPPELRRRFTFGTFFFDLPTSAERRAIWNLYRTKFEIHDQNLPSDEGWTGAEIRQCTQLAYLLNCSLIEAATYVVPVSVSAASQIDTLRDEAHKRFLSASFPGMFDKGSSSVPLPTTRTISLSDGIE